MDAFNRNPQRTWLVGAGLVLLVALGVGGWYAMRTPTAPPGNMPAVRTSGANLKPLPNGGTLPLLPDGGVGAAMSTADMEKIKKGGTVEMKMPGGGSVTFGPPPKKEKSK